MTDLLANPKLRPELQTFLAIEGRERLYACWDRIWVPTPSTKEAFLALQDCMASAPSSKPRGLVITGDADTGKSRTMKAFLDKYPPTLNPETEYAQHPVIYLLAPDNPSRTAVLKKILEALGHPHRAPSVTLCFRCGESLCAPSIAASCHDHLAWILEQERILDRGWAMLAGEPIRAHIYFAIVRQIAALLVNGPRAPALRAVVADNLGGDFCNA